MCNIKKKNEVTKSFRSYKIIQKKIPISLYQQAGPRSTRSLHLFICLFVALCIPTYNMHNEYITYIVALMRLYLGQLDSCFEC